MNKKIRHSILVLFGLLLLLGTLYIPVLIERPEQVSKVELGYPLGFVVQDYTTDSRPFRFPVYWRFDISSGATIASFSIWKFIVSWMVIFAITEGVIYVLEILYIKAREIFKKG